MSRPKKKPNYNSEKIMEELLEEVAAIYISADGNPCYSIRKIADEFDMTPLKVRKLLLTAGVFSSEISEKINELKKAGRTILEIQKITGLSRASVHSYLPYTKMIYNTEELSLNAQRIRTFRERKSAVACLEEKMKEKTTSSILEDALWRTISIFDDYPFYTMHGLRFTYSLKGNEIFVSRKEKAITRSTIVLALHKTLELQQNVTGPKQLGTFGASYLYSMFKHFRVIL